jgi:hypothetical protein
MAIPTPITQISKQFSGSFFQKRTASTSYFASSISLIAGRLIFMDAFRGRTGTIRICVGI